MIRTGGQKGDGLRPEERDFTHPAGRTEFLVVDRWVKGSTVGCGEPKRTPTTPTNLIFAPDI
jgi:hypothetical protein